MTTNPLTAVRHAATQRTTAIGAYRQSIIQARHAGETLRAIAEAAGTDPPAIHRIIERHSPPERMTPEALRRLDRRYRHGRTDTNG